MGTFDELHPAVQNMVSRMIRGLHEAQAGSLRPINLREFTFYVGIADYNFLVTQKDSPVTYATRDDSVPHSVPHSTSARIFSEHYNQARERVELQIAGVPVTWREGLQAADILLVREVAL